MIIINHNKVMNMDFLNRKTEIGWLEEMHLHSQKKLFPVVIYGPRRVGKTTLVKRFMAKKNALYIYVNETKSSHVLAKEVSENIKKAEELDEFTAFDSWDGILKYLIEKSGFEAIIFDEFQNFASVEKSVFGTLQDLLDSNENHAGPLLVFMGSSTGIIKEIFEDQAAALYGRVKAKLRMKPMAFQDIAQGMNRFGYSDKLDIAGFFFVFGGYPKYLVCLEDFEVGVRPLHGILEQLFFRENAPLRDEVKDLLQAEFGSRGAQNYAILEAIAGGHTKLSEIASYIGMPATSVSPFLNKLCEHHEVIEKNTPLLRPSVKDTRYSIKNPIFRFWFRFVRPYSAQLELGRYGQFKQELKKDFDSYAGREFEGLCREFLTSKAGKENLNISQIGKWWHKDNEIDIVTLGRENYAWECKWSMVKARDAGRIAAKLEQNASIAGIKNAKKGLFAQEIEENAKEHFDYVITLNDIFRNKLPRGKQTG